MKYSGVPWIGNIPVSWDVIKLKNLFFLSKSKAKEDNPVVLSLARDGVKVRDITNNEGQLAENYNDYNPVLPGDLLLNPMDLYSGANCNMSEVSGVISPAYANLRAKVRLNPKFYDYFFKTQYWTMAMFAHGKGVSFDNRWTINNETLFNYLVPWVNKKTQDTVVDFLNDKVSQIDKLLSLENAQIEKLIEYKKTLIYELVTKGIDRDVPMKESEIEWIGTMPAHWKRKKAIHLFEEIGSGTTPKGDSYYANGQIPWIQSGDINGGDMHSCSTKVTDLALDDCSALKVYKSPYLIIAMYGGSVGHLSISHIDACCNQACCVMRKPDCDFLYAFYSLTAAKDYLLKSAVGGGQPNISQTILKQLWFCLPPRDEQRAIANYLKEKCDEIDLLIGLKQRKKDALLEYKKSLIFEYVTGKKEVN